MNVGKCVACGKTVYELEAMKVGGVSDPKVFHKGPLFLLAFPLPSPTSAATHNSTVI